jgi:large subunit ribosomal protein L1
MAEAKKTTKKTTKKVEEEIIETPVVETVKEVKPAKAGKRSAKAIEESEAKVAKEERKEAEAADEAPKAKAFQPPTRPLIERRGKGYRKSAELVDKTKAHTLKEGLDLAIKTSHVKFDASVELHVRLNIDPRQADQNLRDIVILPAGTGKDVRVAVFADADQIAAAKKAGADVAGAEEFLQQLDKGTIDFDVLVTTPQMMAKLGKYARVLGPKGLMPNPKSGTVTTDIAKAVKEAKAGRVEYRVDSTGIVHVAVGKVSFGSEKLMQNTQAILASLKSSKPTGLKGNYMKSMFLTTSMGPSIQLADTLSS